MNSQKFLPREATEFVKIWAEKEPAFSRKNSSSKHRDCSRTVLVEVQRPESRSKSKFWWKSKGQSANSRSDHHQKLHHQKLLWISRWEVALLWGWNLRPLSNPYLILLLGNQRICCKLCINPNPTRMTEQSISKSFKDFWKISPNNLIPGDDYVKVKDEVSKVSQLFSNFETVWKF